MGLSKLITIALSFLVLIAGVSDAFAAQKRITGSQLAALLYGREHTVYMPTGIGFTVQYDKNGVMYSGGKRTGDVVRATRSTWCNFHGTKLNRCLTVWKDAKFYVAKERNGKPAFAFTVR